MRISLPMLVVVSILRASSVCAQQAPPAVSVVPRAADVIQSNYFDEAKASALARELRAALARGEFDTIADPRDLAAALSSRLEREDGHLRVQWTSPDTQEAPRARTSDRMPEDVRAPRWNFGFRRVEVLAGNVGLIELSEFADVDTASNWDSAARRVADATLAMVERTDALIFDLRDNGGGGGMADYLLSHFLPPDVVFSEMRGRAGRHENRTLVRIGGQRRLDVPIYVLVSGRTGSAAEFFAYSLQAARRGTIVGQRTAGAANPGRMFDIGDGFEILVPLDTPVNRHTGTNWEGDGVQPDIPVDTERSLVRAQTAALEHVLRQNTLAAPQARDARWVLEALSARQAAPTPSLDEFAGTYGARVVRVERAGLVIERARWPGRRLRPLGADVFFVEGTPWRRVAFERDQGKVIALVELTSAGDATRWRKQAP